MPKVEVLYAYLAEDDEGDEGIIPMLLGGQIMPLIGADMERMESLRPFAEQAAAVRGKPVTLALFSVRTDTDVIQPPREG